MTMDYYNTPDKAEYLGENGWHFNKKACEYAVQFLKDKDNKPIKPLTKEEVDAMLQRHSVKLERMSDGITSTWLIWRRAIWTEADSRMRGVRLCTSRW